ncbi:MAG: D-isomer specific 2-hydroxyacid dehydrogenase, NAD-binding [Tardiphaga sp.]|nr:D-isomer specific 2-hydroxyacid dehydrogenase, NAD-binding [Tardiphaga sp.]
MRCVLLSQTLDLRAHLATEIARLKGQITFVDHPDATPDAIEMAVAWYPPADAFAHYPNLKAVCSIAAGADSILHCPSLREGIDVVRVVEPAQAQMMSGFVTWHVIWHQRGFRKHLAHQSARRWERFAQRPARDVPVGILGYGEMGQRVASDLARLGFPVHAWSRTAKPMADNVIGFHGTEGLAAMLREAEVLVNLLPLTPETRGLLDSDLFARMKPGGYVIQVGRGEHLVEADLLAALDSGQLAGASLDVFLAEPLPTAHPFWSHPNIVLTPHDACDVSVPAVGQTIEHTANALRAGVRPAHAVDRARGY